jgi:hypothetical protein
LQALDKRKALGQRRKKAITYFPDKELSPMSILPYSPTFDQQTMTRLMEHDPVAQHYRQFLALFDWSVVRAFAWSGRIRHWIGKDLPIDEGKQRAVALHDGIMFHHQGQRALVKETRIW